MYANPMKLPLLLLAFTLAVPLIHAQTGAMSPETKAPAAKPAKTYTPSHSLSVTFQGSTVTLSVEDLLKLPQHIVTAHDGHSNKDIPFSGPLVSDVLAKAGLTATPETHPLILHSSVIATGTDGYFVLYSAAELEQRFTSGQVIVAVMQFGLPVPSGIQLVDPLDVIPARWVHGLTSLSVMSVAPAK